MNTVRGQARRDPLYLHTSKYVVYYNLCASNTNGVGFNSPAPKLDTDTLGNGMVVPHLREGILLQESPRNSLGVNRLVVYA